MKGPSGVRLLLLALTLALAWGGRLHIKRSARNPIAKIVNLLQDLQKSAEKKAEVEQELYNKFVCVSNRTIQEKQDSISQARSRIDILKQRIAEVSAGLAAAKGQDEQIKKEILAVEAEINASARARAAEVTRANVVNNSKSVDALSPLLRLLSLPSFTPSMVADAMKKSDVEEAIRLGDKYLSKADAVFLRGVLTLRTTSSTLLRAPASPNPSRTSEIVQTFSGLKEQFSASLKKAKKEAEDAYWNYLTMDDAKENELAAAKEALAKLRLLHAERIKADTDAKSESQELREQIISENTFLANLKKAMKQKENEFNERAIVRQEEVDAIGEAINILRSEDFHLQGVFQRSMSFLQSSSVRSNQRQAAASLLLQTREADTRVLEIAQLLLADRNPGIGMVIDRIGNITSTLRQEQASDLKLRDDCRETLRQDQHAINKTADSINDLTTDKESLAEEVQAILFRINEREKEINDTIEELSDARALRNSERREYLKTRQQDQLALSLVQQATKKIMDFYNENGASLIQKQHDMDHPAQVAGVVRTMEMVRDDLTKDFALAEKEEAAAQKLFLDSSKSLLEQHEKLETINTNLEVQRSSKDQDLRATKASLATSTQSLKVLDQKLKASKHKCDWLLANFDKRREGRQTEIDSLAKAKVVLGSAGGETAAISKAAPTNSSSVPANASKALANRSF